jgi:hypothetical protein
VHSSRGTDFKRSEERRKSPKRLKGFPFPTDFLTDGYSGICRDSSGACGSFSHRRSRASLHIPEKFLSRSLETARLSAKEEREAKSNVAFRG